MIGKITAAALAVSGALVAGSAAFAATVDFSSFGANANLGIGNSQTYTGSDSTVVTATAFNGINAAALREQIGGGSWDGGIGVSSPASTNPQMETGHNVEFDFGFDVNILSVSLARTGVSVDGPAFSVTLDGIFDTGGNVDAGDLGTYFLKNITTSGNSGQVVSIANVGTTDGFYISEIEYELVSAEVPLPAGAVLLIGALGAGAVVTRRRKKAA